MIEEEEMTDAVKMAIAEQAANLTVPEDGKFGGPCTYKRLWYIARDAALAALEQGNDEEHLDDCGCDAKRCKNVDEQVAIAALSSAKRGEG